MFNSKTGRLSLLLAAVSLVLCQAVRATPAVDPEIPDYQPQPARPDAHAGFVGKDGTLRIAGADHVDFIVERFNAALKDVHPDWNFRIESKGTTSAVPLLTHDMTMFGAMGRAINPLETSAYRKIVGAPPLEVRVAYTSDDTSQHLATSLAAYVNRANPLNNLTVEQINRMLTIGNPQGDLSRWGQLGLEGEWASRQIRPYGTPEFTGFGTYMQKSQLGNLPLAPTYEAYGKTELILERLAADPAGVGIAAIGLENDKIKQLGIIDGKTGAITTGTPAQVADGSYPYGRYLYFYVRREPGKGIDPMVREYLRFVLSRQGQTLIASQPKGYIPLTAKDARAQLAKLDEVAPL
ncbi:phosphate-binding protein [Pseudomonas syringae pv. actinidifoliorum]|nr:phosphate-binding protein [Pseudomonas syringae pv. actinidifoliorum]MDU8519319.1 phosphate-binding protein [Pseudomonas syringae pv. actinidifoliorum]MDU8525541.1 phosphate-binding protein [Pseudomonas syringae pv. actinidifoliorum]